MTQNLSSRGWGLMNGYHAIKGFEYQTTVSLDLILGYFHTSKDNVLVRPEGEDDLVIACGDRYEYIQIKKPRENAAGELTRRPWSVSELVKEILLPSYERIADNQDHQTVILGDEVDPEISEITCNCGSVTPKSMLAYLQVLHLIACGKTKISAGSSHRIRVSAVKKANSMDEALLLMADAFIKSAESKGTPKKIYRQYRASLFEIHKSLPSVLSRTKIISTYGTEKEIRERINDYLTKHYHLSEDIVKNSLIRNLRGFLYDIVTEPGKWITHEHLECEIRNIWPRMTFIGEPPSLSSHHIRRPTFIKRLIESCVKGPTQVLGVSGSGKTLIAREIMEYAKLPEINMETIYAEVTSNSDFRDVLTGITFGLRNFGVTKPFSLAVEPSMSTEKVLQEVANELDVVVVAKPICVLLDFVDGTCNNRFARNMRDFLKDFNSDYVHVIAMAQEDVFRELSSLQRMSLQIPAPIYVPGFDFEEFLALFNLHHKESYNRATLWELFEQLTAGRSAGLFARLADSIAQGTIDEMRQWVALPPEQIMEEADRSRYLRLPDRLKFAANKIICFLVPFSLEEATRAFPDDYIAETIHQMLQYGLLRYHDEQLLEMHETTRSGLERFIPPEWTARNHGELANHYLGKSDSVAAIFHLERSDQKEKARKIATESFLQGKNWASLFAYVVKRKLVSARELVAFMSENPLNKTAYLLPDLFREIGHDETAQELFLLISSHLERFIKDFQWSWLITESILTCDPTMIQPLLVFGLEKAKQGEPTVLEHLVFGARRSIVLVDSGLLSIFARETDDIKLQLIPILLRSKQRTALRTALEFISSYYSKDIRGTRVSQVNTILDQLPFADEEDVVQFISAIPAIGEVRDIAIAKSALLGNLAGFIWKRRYLLQPVCKKLLASDGEDETTTENALRLLVFTGDDEVIKPLEQLIGRDGHLANVATALITLVPSLLDLNAYKQGLFNTQLDFKQRLAAFYILRAVSDDVDEWFDTLCMHDPTNVSKWEYVHLISCASHPCKSAVPILRRWLLDESYQVSSHVCAALLSKIGELPGQEGTDFLISLLSNPFPEIRITACISLQLHRSKRALPALLALGLREENEGVGQTAIMAAMASGCLDYSDFNNLWQRFPQATIWRCILAGRLQVKSESAFLADTAIDPHQHWQVRRAAILAAGWLHSRPVMEEIAKFVFNEKLQFTLDKNPSLLGHSILSAICLDVARDFRDRYHLERDWCHNFVEDLFEEPRNQSLFSHGTPGGADAAKWLFQKLESQGWPENLNGADRVNNELHTPILYAAVLRGLRLCECLDVIERIIATTDSEWVLVRALIEWRKGKSTSSEELDKIRRIVQSNPVGDSVSVRNVLGEIGPHTSIQSVSAQCEDKEPHWHGITYNDIKAALKGGELQVNVALVILGLDKIQFLELVTELSPDNDYRQQWVPTKPQLGFTENGYSVKGVRSQSVETHARIRASLRPALFAANRFNVSIPWHRELLMNNKHGNNDYVKKLLVTLGVQKHSQKLYQELELYGDIYLAQLADTTTFDAVKGSLDYRILPVLRRWSSSGNDEFLEVLCKIACCVEEESILEVLSQLFYRWCQLLRNNYKNHVYTNPYLWRVLRYLKEHHQFTRIRDYDLRLAELLELNIPWFNRIDIVDVIATSPRMYCKIETLLIGAEPFEHFYLDDVERLDNAGRRLFFDKMTTS